ncbi:hypothetical protein JW752_02980 [Candidatus Peregrinibacteria bacterium]|nr:hypothetical protein [Candidatus Peregrinibacteria bacterium]
MGFLDGFLKTPEEREKEAELDDRKKAIDRKAESGFNATGDYNRHYAERRRELPSATDRLVRGVRILLGKIRRKR